MTVTSIRVEKTMKHVSKAILVSYDRQKDFLLRRLLGPGLSSIPARIRNIASAFISESNSWLSAYNDRLTLTLALAAIWFKNFSKKLDLALDFVFHPKRNGTDVSCLRRCLRRWELSTMKNEPRSTHCRNQAFTDDPWLFTITLSPKTRLKTTKSFRKRIFSEERSTTRVIATAIAAPPPFFWYSYCLLVDHLAYICNAVGVHQTWTSEGSSANWTTAPWHTFSITSY